MKKKRYEIKCYVKNPTLEMHAVFCRLVEGDQFIIDKGWENGYHVKLKGSLTKDDLDQKVALLKGMLDDVETEYEVEEFRKQYRPVMELLGEEDSTLTPVYQKEIFVRNLPSIFGNELYDSLFMYVNHIFDDYYCPKYFQDYSIYDIMKDIYPYHLSLSKRVRTNVDAFNCHLSHYVGFMHPLGANDKMRIAKKFEKKFVEDQKEIYEIENAPQNGLVAKLEEFHLTIQPLIHEKKLGFCAPYVREDALKRVESGSWGHRKTFEDDNFKEFEFDEVAITNRWVVNALYKKLLLLNLKNIDRFYMNYVFSRLNYSEDVWDLHEISLRKLEQLH